MVSQYIKFEDKVKDNNNALYVTIPYKQAKFEGIKKGSTVKVMVKLAGGIDNGKEDIKTNG